MPAHTEWPASSEIWILSDKEVPPSGLDLGPAPNDREVRYFEAIARLKPGVSFEAAQQDLNRVAAIIQQHNLPLAKRRDIRIQELREEIVGDIRGALLLLQGAVGLVLLIACANVSSLLIARATGRRRELAVRAALGAGRGRLIRQLLTESVLLGIAGGIAGLLLGGWLIVLLTRVLPATVPRADTIGLDRVVGLVTVGVALVTGVLFGVMPALQASYTDAQSALKQAGERGGTGSVRALGRSVLVVGEVALTLVLLAGAGLLLNSLIRLQHVDSGLKTENVTVAPLVLPQSRYPARASQVDIYRRLIERLSQQSGVQSVAVMFPAPLRGNSAGGTFDIEGGPRGNSADRAYASLGSVSGAFFAAMGIPMIAGRTFTDSDVKDAPPVVIVSAALARKYWPNEDPIGKRLKFDDNPNARWTTVVGIVGDVRQLGLSQPPPPILYFSYQQFALPFTNVVVRSTAPTATVAALIRSELKTLDADLTANNISSLQGLLDRSIAQPRFRTWLFGAFALVALLLAAVGVYGLISYSVSQRTREIGIRVALGAQPSQVLLQIMREGMRLTLIGVALGLAAAFAGARILATFLFGVEPSDPLTFVSVALLLLVVAGLATYIPSRRALGVDPLVALRTE
jgi:putative ABC transport system permease protein